jgi:hypothetical protein
MDQIDRNLDRIRVALERRSSAAEGTEIDVHGDTDTKLFFGSASTRGVVKRDDLVVPSKPAEVEIGETTNSGEPGGRDVWSLIRRRLGLDF